MKHIKLRELIPGMLLMRDSYRFFIVGVDGPKFWYICYEPTKYSTIVRYSHRRNGESIAISQINFILGPTSQ